MNSLNRENDINTLSSTSFDLIIIGGGITGAGIALDAVVRGLKVALIEKADFASGTSGRSTKLIHGGLRYLKQMDFALVRESGTERAIVHRLAPHLVLPEKMLLPLVEGGSYGKFLTSLGLKLYDILAKVEGEDRRQMLDVEETLAKEPLLSKAKLKGSGYYAEYRTDDVRLTVEILKKAASLGVPCLNYVSCVGFEKEDSIIKSVICKDVLTGNEFEIKSKLVVSATGPWVDQVRLVDDPGRDKRLHLTKGVHIVVPHHKLPVSQTIYFDVPDGRMIFAIPRQNITYVGTTDTTYNDDLDHIRVSRQDAEYLLEAVNGCFEGVDLSLTDVVSSWAGLRPLIHEEGKSPSELSRKDEIFLAESGLISIAGGKLTGYRKMAKRIVDLVFDKLDKKDPGCTTDKIPLTSDPIESKDELPGLKHELHTLLSEKGVSDRSKSDYLLFSYGKEAFSIVQNMELNDNPELALMKSELLYAIQNEMVITAADFIERRTGNLYFEIDEARAKLPFVLGEMQKELSWDEKRLEKEKSEMHKLFKEAITFV